MRLDLVDTTLRDGEQMPGVYFTPKQKVELASLSSKFGARIIELMPAVSDSEKKLAKTLSNEGLNADLRAMCFLRKESIEQALSLDMKRVMPFTSLSDIHLKTKLNVSYEENLLNSLEVVDFAKEHGLIVDFGIEDATRASLENLSFFINSFGRKIDYFVIADTVSVLTPLTSFLFFLNLKKSTNAKIEFHGHNDFGLATANTLSAIESKVDAFSGTFCGIGERAGNTPIEEVYAALRFLNKKKLPVNYKLLKKICDRVQALSEVPLSPNKPVVGQNAFTHESGVHVDGVLKNPRNYEPFNPDLIGAKRKFIYGKHSGRKLIKNLLIKKGYKLDDNQLKLFLNKVKFLSEFQKKALSEEEVIYLFENFEKEGD